jgi:hypothetical protein
MMDGDTFELQLDAVGAEAVQQTLDALGIKAEQVTAAAAGPEGEAPAPAPTSGFPAGQATPPPEIDLAGIMAAIDRTNDLLAAILTALENRPTTPNPTY